MYLFVADGCFKFDGGVVLRVLCKLLSHDNARGLKVRFIIKFKFVLFWEVSKSSTMGL